MHLHPRLSRLSLAMAIFMGAVEAAITYLSAPAIHYWAVYLPILVVTVIGVTVGAELLMDSRLSAETTKWPAGWAMVISVVLAFSLAVFTFVWRHWQLWGAHHLDIAWYALAAGCLGMLLSILVGATVAPPKPVSESAGTGFTDVTPMGRAPSPPMAAVPEAAEEPAQEPADPISA
jgi:hypothetical protein